MSHVIGVDPSLTGTGVAHISDQQFIQTWVKRTGPTAPDAPIGDVSERIKSIVRWLFDPEINLVNTGTVLAVVEEPLKATHGGAGLGKPMERHWLFGRVIDGFCHRGIPVVAINPTWAKGYLCGNGAAKKDDMQRAVVATWPGRGLHLIDDNQADAVALAAMGVDWLGWPGPYLDGRRGAGWLKKAQWPEREAVRA